MEWKEVGGQGQFLALFLVASVVVVRCMGALPVQVGDEEGGRRDGFGFPGYEGRLDEGEQEVVDSWSMIPLSDPSNSGWGIDEVSC